MEAEGVELPSATFAVFPGEPRKPKADLPLDTSIFVGKEQAIIDGDETAINQILAQISPRDALGTACLVAGKRDDGAIGPARISKVKDALFGAEASEQLLKAILHAAAREKSTSFKEPKPSFRAHMFLRQIQGMWACSNPACTEIDPAYSYDGRQIGKIFKQPAIKCPCGGQVLELLYCYDCGEAYLGGYVVPRSGEDADGDVFLESGPTDLSTTVPGLVNERPNSQFRWYWPGKSVAPGVSSTWQHTNPATKKPETFSFAPAVYHPLYGHLHKAQAGEKPTGTMYQVPGKVDVPGLPEICPACQSKKSQNRILKAFFSGSRVNSPIRGLRTGLNVTTQVIADRATSSLGSETRAAPMIAFTDSRDDAADVAAGLELNHFRSLVRQLVFAELRPREKFTIGDATSVAEKVQDDQDLDERETEIAASIASFSPDLMNALFMATIGRAKESQKNLVEEFAGKTLGSSAISWSQLVSGVLAWLLELGEKTMHRRTNTSACWSEKYALSEWTWSTFWSVALFHSTLPDLEYRTCTWSSFTLTPLSSWSLTSIATTKLSTTTGRSLRRLPACPRITLAGRKSRGRDSWPTKTTSISCTL
ncbi:hypothetical protein JI744_16920 [Tabrizicola sp. KVB23]|uniref:Uncharacterized protein n=2 Tax=Fuscibacter oryzae TaxID=2803939 RepID=A0A8J7MR88_9RHOB|nr:hypothetical protein [Fuscibacter oryzae]